jgi:hypothetical protein
MSFQPPFCPRRDCAFHLAPTASFCIRWGSYQPDCRDDPVPRFRCRGCRSTFSRQSFRHDCGDRQPAKNSRLLELLTSGIGYRQSGRVLRLSTTAVQHKARKIARTCWYLHANLRDRLGHGRTFVLDEEETYEQASIRTLTVPIVIEHDSWFVVATAVGAIRRRAVAGSQRRRWQENDERKHGRRRDRSRRCVARVLRDLDQQVAGQSLVLRSDEKSSYATLAQQVFGDRVRHETTPSRLPRTTHNPLFAINTTIAMSRDLCGRLRRHSWLVSKKARWLRRHLAMFVAWRNYVRRRFNYDQEDRTPAVILGLVPRNLACEEVLGWRQDWGRHSIHPLNSTGSASGCRYQTTPAA